MKPSHPSSRSIFSILALVFLFVLIMYSILFAEAWLGSLLMVSAILLGVIVAIVRASRK